jgi:hypothetical protein
MFEIIMYRDCKESFRSSRDTFKSAKRYAKKIALHNKALVVVYNGIKVYEVDGAKEKDDLVTWFFYSIAIIFMAFYGWWIIQTIFSL